MAFDIVVSHLHWCHAEVIWSKEQHRDLQIFIQWHSLSCTVEDRIVHHEYSSKAPVGILMVKVTDKFHDEETKGIAVGVTTVHSEQELSTSG